MVGSLRLLCVDEKNLGRESFYDDDDDDDFFFIFWLNVYWKEMSGLRIL